MVTGNSGSGNDREDKGGTKTGQRKHRAVNDSTVVRSSQQNGVEKMEVQK